MPDREISRPSDAHRALVAALRTGINELRPLFRHLTSSLVTIGRRDEAGLKQRYDSLWQHIVAEPRRDIVHRAVTRAAQGRFDALQRQIAQRVRRPPTLSPQLVDAAVRRVIERRRSSSQWRYADLHWPRDRWIKRTFFWSLEDAKRRVVVAKKRRDRLTAAELQVTIDPRLKKIAYPIDPDLSAEDLIQRAADTVVMARGEYFATVGMRDAARAVDRAVSAVISGEVIDIVGWRWSLSPAHEPGKCPSGVCEAIAEFDAGGPAGPGTYYDSALPQSHGNCWCDLQAIYSDETDGEIPQPDPGYESRVMGLMAQYGVNMLLAA